ncbi:MAG: glycosyltransferase family 39 protein [Bacteroidales bacterium]|nr:glycosyltransferase family 39 protein [Bacteroidales bacterium]
MDQHTAKLSARQRNNLAIGLIMLVAAFMRFYHFADWSLSNDELSALNRLRFTDFSEMILNGVKLGDFHPAGVQTMLWFWIKFFGDSVWVIRLPFVIFGILSVWMVYLIGKKWFGNSTALFSAATLAFLQYPILYSQLARPYAPGLFFALVAVWFWTKIVFGQNRRWIHFSGFAIFALLTAYVHNYSFLFVIIVGFSGFIFYKRLDIKKYILVSLAAGLLYLPHLNIFLYQFGIGGVGGNEGWLGKPESTWILDYLWYAFNESWFLISILILLCIYPIIKLPIKISWFHILGLSWFLIMFLIGYFYSIWRNPILQFSILIFSFPFLLLFIFSFLNQKPTTTSYLILVLFVSFGVFHTHFINKFYTQQHFGEFKGVAEKIADWNKKLGKENVSNAIVVNGPFYIEYYLEKYSSEINLLQLDNKGGSDLLNLKCILDSVQTPWFIHAWTKPAPAEIDLLIRDKYPCVFSRINYGGLSEVSLYSKFEKDSCSRLSEPVFVYRRNFDDENKLEHYGKNLESNTYISAPNAYRLDSTTIFIPGFKSSISEISNGNFNRIEIEIAAFSEEKIENTVIVLSLDRSKENYFWKGSQIQNFVVPGTWGKAFLSYSFSETFSPEDILNIYFWNQGKSSLLLDNFEARFYLDSSTNSL